MKGNYKIYLKDILNAMESIEKFVEDMSFEEFRADDKTSSAVMRDNRGSDKESSQGDKEKISKGSMERNGRNERQIDPFLFRRGL